MSGKLDINLVHIWEHVSEAGSEDDAAAKHGEAGEQGHHGGRPQKRVNIIRFFGLLSQTCWLSI